MIDDVTSASKEEACEREWIQNGGTFNKTEEHHQIHYYENSYNYIPQIISMSRDAIPLLQIPYFLVFAF